MPWVEKAVGAEVHWCPRASRAPFVDHGLRLR